MRIPDRVADLENPELAADDAKAAEDLANHAAWAAAERHRRRLSWAEAKRLALAAADSGDPVEFPSGRDLHYWLAELRVFLPALAFREGVHCTEPAVWVRWQLDATSGRFAERDHVVRAYRWWPNGPIIGGVWTEAGRKGVYSGGRFVPLTPGDWVVVYPSGQTLAMTHEQFDERFSLLPEVKS